MFPLPKFTRRKSRVYSTTSKTSRLIQLGLQRQSCGTNDFSRAFIINGPSRLAKISGVHHYEERMLYMLML